MRFDDTYEKIIGDAGNGIPPGTDRTDIDEGIGGAVRNLALATALGTLPVTSDAGTKDSKPAMSREIKKTITDYLDDFPLIRAIAMHESGMDPFAIGDRHLRNRAYGILQIRQPVLDDVNRKFGTSYTVKDVYPKTSGDADVRRAVHNSVVIFNKYMEMYGRNATDEQKARRWNGGPSGDRREITGRYWDKVSEYMRG